MFKFLMAGTVVAAALGGCGTLVNGSSQDIFMSSDPPGASFNITGHGNYTAPTTVKLSRKQRWLVTVSLDGYETEQVLIRQTLSGAVAGNILLGGAIGLLVDMASGGANTLVPDKLNLMLVPTAALVETDPMRVLEQHRQEGKITEAEFNDRKTILDKTFKPQAGSMDLANR